MNVLHRWQSSLMAVCLGISCLVIGGRSPAHAQTVPSNPLRALEAPAIAEASSIQQAVATEPVRMAVHSEQSVPPPPAARTYQRAAQPAAFSYGSRTPRQVPRGFVPRHELVAGVQATEELTVEPFPADVPGEIVMDPSMVPEPQLGTDCCDTPAVADCGGCGSCGGCLIPCPILALDNIE